MKAVVPVQDDLDLGITNTMTYDSAPSSPKRSDDPFDLYCRCTSAPTSPTRAAAIYAHLCSNGSSNSYLPSSAASGVPFNWEEKPGTPKSHLIATNDDAFAFGFKEKMETTVDELLEEVKIQPLKPPPRLRYPTMDDRSSLTSSPRSPRSPRPRGLWSSGHQRKGGVEKELDPFTIAMVEATRDRSTGREKAPPTSSSDNPSKGGARSKWPLRELLLFRSASRDLLGDYTLLSSSSSSNRKVGTDEEDGRNNADLGSTHCMEDGAASTEEPKKKTHHALRRRQGLLSCIRFNAGGRSYSFGRGH